MKSVYLETSIISYLTARPSQDLILAAHQEVTRQWWNERRNRFELFVSRLVIDEVSRGDPDAVARRLNAIQGLSALPIVPDAIRLAKRLIDTEALPRVAVEDALHIGLSAVNGIHYLLTWNCKHIANAERLWQINDLIRGEGLEPPLICTPEEFLESNHEERPDR